MLALQTLGIAALPVQIAIDRLALSGGITDFETGAAVRLTTAKEVQIGKHRIGLTEQFQIGPVDPGRLLTRQLDLVRHLLIQRIQTDEAELGTQGLEPLTMINGIRPKYSGASEIDAQRH